MRLPTAVASILAVGLVTAACGGDDATPEPAEEATTAPVATEAAEEPAGEATEAPAEEASETPVEEATEVAVAEAEFGKKVALDSTTDPAAIYGLTAGRYRMQWSSTDCEQVDFLVSQVDGDFSYPKPSRSSFASATINDLPEGSYTVEQLDPDCADWSVRIDWMTK